MVRFHCSFLVRWWQLDHGGPRIEVEHIQSGSKAVTRSLAEALAWMSRNIEGNTGVTDESTPEMSEGQERNGANRTKPHGED